MVDGGLFQAHGAPNTVRRFLLADVKALAAPITLHDAEILECTVEKVHEFIAAGVFTPTGNSLRSVRRVQVERRGARKNPVWIPGTRWAEPQRHDGTVNTKGAARLGIHSTRQLAAAGLIPVTKDANGNYRFRVDHLELTAKACRAADENDRRDCCFGSSVRGGSPVGQVPRGERAGRCPSSRVGHHGRPSRLHSESRQAGDPGLVRLTQWKALTAGDPARDRVPSKQGG